MSAIRNGIATTGMRSALAALVLSAALAGWALVRAIRIDAVPDAPASVLSGGELLVAPPPAAPVDVRFAVDNDLFSPDRSAPANRYRMPGEPIPAPGGDVEEAPAEPVLLGTAVGAGQRSFVTCRLGDGPPVILRVGDKIGAYTLRSIERGRAVFVSTAGKRLEVRALTSEQ